MNDEDIIAEILEREGAEYTNDPADAGGPTKYGITLETLREVRGAAVTAADVQALTEADARAIYRKRYITGPGFDRLPNLGLRSAVVDFGVHSGPETATRALQRVLGVPRDGVCGAATVRAVQGADQRRVAILVCCERLRLLGELVTKRPQNAKFAHGWNNRVADLIGGLA